MLFEKKMRLTVITVVLLLGISSFGAVKTVNNRTAPIGIVSALPFETTYLKSKIDNCKVYRYFNRDYFRGTIDGRDVVVAQVGIGVINAAVGTAILIDKFSPSAIILTGVAGGTTKTAPGDIIIAKSVTFYDFGSLSKKGEFTRLRAFEPDSAFSGKGVKHDPLFYKSSPELTATIKKVSSKIKLKSLEFKGKVYKSRIIHGIITTSETFNENPAKIREIMQRTGCIAFEMEGAGVAQVCYNQNIPFLMIKAISDSGDFQMFNALKKPAAKNAERLIKDALKSTKTEKKSQAHT